MKYISIKIREDCVKTLINQIAFASDLALDNLDCYKKDAKEFKEAYKELRELLRIQEAISESNL